MVCITVMGVSCGNKVDVKYVDLDITNSTPEEVDVTCSINYTVWYVVKAGDKSSRRVTIVANSSKSMTLAYNPNTVSVEEL